MQRLGKLAICFWCDEVYYLIDWDEGWDESGCPVCIADRNQQVDDELRDRN